MSSKPTTSSFDAFLALQGNHFQTSDPGFTTASETLPPPAPVAPHFWGKDESKLTELERLQCDRYRLDLEHYNLYLQQQEVARIELLRIKQAEIDALERELRVQSDLVKVCFYYLYFIIIIIISFIYFIYFF